MRKWTGGAGLRSAVVLAGVVLGGAVLPTLPRAAVGQLQNGIPQQGGQIPGQRGGVNGGDRSEEHTPFSKETEERMAKARNDERQKRLIADSEKLLALATALHEEVMKTDKNILSVDVVKKAAEMEKLSRDLKERMKG